MYLTPWGPDRKEWGDPKWKVKSQPCPGKCTNHRIMEHSCFSGSLYLRTSGALYPVLLLISRLNFSFFFFFFHFNLIISHPLTRQSAVKSLASSLWWPTCGHRELLLGTSQIVSSPGWTSTAASACPYVLPPWTSWWPSAELPSVHWCLPLDALQRWSLFDFDTAAHHIWSHYMLSADQEQPQKVISGIS